jgi:hypothetical protein
MRFRGNVAAIIPGRRRHLADEPALLRQTSPLSCDSHPKVDGADHDRVRFVRFSKHMARWRLSTQAVRFPWS